jgi:hypothetical protein
MEIATLTLEIINTIAIVAGAVVAIRGINSWRSQLRGETDYQLARRFLKSVYKVREAVKYVRNPFIPAGEITTALKESGLGEEEYSNQEKSNRAVYSARWKKVMDASADLNVELLDAEVSWGKDVTKTTEGFNDQVTKLYVALKMFLELREVKPERDIIYDMGETDPFNAKMTGAINKIEDFLKPHLK